MCRYKKKQHTKNSMWLFVGVNRLKWLIRRKQYHINTGGKEGRLPVNILISISFFIMKTQEAKTMITLMCSVVHGVINKCVAEVKVSPSFF